VIQDTAKVQYCFPTTVEEAYSLKEQYGEKAHYIAGGTDLLLLLEREKDQPQALIDLTRIPALQRLEVSNDQILIGSGVTYSRLLDYDPIRTRTPFLASAIHTIGGVQIRNIATLTGNLVNASPAGDALPPLYCLETKVLIEGPQGRRSLPVSEFIIGVRRTALLPGELVTAVVFGIPETGWVSRFDKLGLRGAMAISVANLAMLLKVEHEIVVQARIALGAVAPTVIRAVEAEACLQNAMLNGKSIEAAANLASAACSPIDDVRASARYRREAVRGLVRRGLSALMNEMHFSE
jgi:CO/xanthine dehydrogenase FAD-binding subunit